MRSITLTHVGYDYMNARLIHGQIFTGCSNSLMGCTQDLQDQQDGLPILEQSPKSEALFLTPICFPILLILSNYNAVTEFRLPASDF